jgi:2-polyprenyl-3-methyl-5-hydroxy-6-metoxy-1,4-benzoquinol methylase
MLRRSRTPIREPASCGPQRTSASGRGTTWIPEDHRFETVLTWLDDHDNYGAALPLLTDADGVIQDPQATRFLSAGRITARKLASLSGLKAGKRISDALRGINVDVEDATAAALVVRSDAYRSVGGFSSEFFFYFEDADLCRKLHRAGWAIRHVRSAWIIHLNGASMSDPHQRKLHYYDGLDLYFKKWHGPAAQVATRMMAAPMRRRNRVVTGHKTAPALERPRPVHPESAGALDDVHLRLTSSPQVGVTTGNRYVYRDDARADLLPLVPGAIRILDVGCGRGAFGAALRRSRPGSKVYGIEMSAEAAAVARDRLDDVICGAYPDDLPADWRDFDCVTFNDVLEHFVDPWRVLADTSGILAPHGKVFAAIPNVRWAPVLLDLAVRGRWHYEETGVLDRTHLRFFTRSSAVELFEESGYKVVMVRATSKSPKMQWLNKALGGRLDGLIAMHTSLVGEWRASPPG